MFNNNVNVYCYVLIFYFFILNPLVFRFLCHFSGIVINPSRRDEVSIYIIGYFFNFFLFSNHLIYVLFLFFMYSIKTSYRAEKRAMGVELAAFAAA